MILTGKAKEDFDKWNYEDDFGYIDHEPTSLVVHFNDLDEDIQNTILIYFFDSVGIYINIGGVFDRILGYHRGFEVHIYQDGKQPISIFNDNDLFETRKQATEQAIIKANQIYNEK